jgi:hypothetical protein
MMNRRLLILDLMLAGILVYAGFAFSRGWRGFTGSHQPAQVQPGAGISPTADVTPVASAATDEDWTDAVEKNPFSFDRNDQEVIVKEPEAAKETRPTPATPKPVLYGVMSIGGERVAMIGPARANTRASMAARVGETFDGWEIVEIQDKTAIVVSNGQREALIMNDPTANVPRDYSKTSSTSRTQSMAPSTAAKAAPPSPAAEAAKSDYVIVPPPAEPEGPKKAEWIQTPFGPRLQEVKPPPQ